MAWLPSGVNHNILADVLAETWDNWTNRGSARTQYQTVICPLETYRPDASYLDSTRPHRLRFCQPARYFIELAEEVDDDEEEADDEDK
ncbi:hypothetical protein BM1_00077 [Bipolaris maydis]|nr:hypothetical protein BM1_00077 [Bipolaris maydis]